MNAWTNSGTDLVFPELDGSVGSMVPAAEDLLRRVTGEEPAVSADSETGVKLRVPLTFPDGVGAGEIVAEVFKYRDAVRFDLRLAHNRVFAHTSGKPTSQSCFLNDFVASISVSKGSTEFPAEFVRGVISGVSAAKDAVRRHNRRSRGPWDEVRVVGTDHPNEG